MNKKASLSEAFFIMLVLVACAMFFIIGWMIMDKVNTQIQGSDTLSPAGKEIINNTATKYPAWFDGIFLTVLVIMWLVAIVLAFQIDAHPIFMVFSIIVYIILIIVAAALGNSFYDFASNAMVAEYAEDFPIISLVMGNFVKVMLVIGFSIGAVMYGKAR